MTVFVSLYKRRGDIALIQYIDRVLTYEQLNQ